MFADVRTEWRVLDIERQLSSAERKLYEIDSLRSDVVRLERAHGEIRAEVDGLRSQLASSTERIEQLERAVQELTTPAAPTP